MGKTAEEILLEISQLQTQMDQAERTLRSIWPELTAALPESLRKSPGLDQLRGSIVETADEGIWVLDDRDETAFVNQKMARMLGYGAAEMFAKPITAFTDKEGPQRIKRALHRCRQGKKETYDMRFVHKGGRDLWTIVSTTPIFDENKRYAGTLKMITDTSERKHLEKRIADIAQREQQRIGRDLRDVLGQTLTGIAFMSEVLHRRLAAEARPEAAEVKEIADLVSQSMKQVRSLAKGLQAISDEPDGLRKALGEYVSDVEDLYGVSCHFECDPGLRVTDHDLATHLYHIVQEAVLNAVNHGKAVAIIVRLSRSPDGRLDLQIANDGLDFPGKSAKRGLGLRIMNQRACAIGALLRVGRGPAGGTLVTCSVPGTTAKEEVEFEHGNSTGNDQ